MGLNLIPWIISALLALGAFGYVVHCEKVKKESAAFIERIQQEAAEQQKRNDDRAKKEHAAKEQSDADAKRRLDDLTHTIARLRNAARPSASPVPAAPAHASRPDLACFDRAELDRAFRERGEGVDRYRAEVLGIAISGAEATIRLNSAREWALKLSTELKSGG